MIIAGYVRERTENGACAFRCQTCGKLFRVQEHLPLGGTASRPVLDPLRRVRLPKFAALGHAVLLTICEEGSLGQHRRYHEAHESCRVVLRAACGHPAGEPVEMTEHGLAVGQLLFDSFVRPVRSGDPATDILVRGNGLIQDMFFAVTEAGRREIEIEQSLAAREPAPAEKGGS